MAPFAHSETDFLWSQVIMFARGFTLQDLLTLVNTAAIIGVRNRALFPWNLRTPCGPILFIQKITMLISSNLIYRCFCHGRLKLFSINLESYAGLGTRRFDWDVVRAVKNSGIGLATWRHRKGSPCWIYKAFEPIEFRNLWNLMWGFMDTWRRTHQNAKRRGEGVPKDIRSG